MSKKKRNKKSSATLSPIPSGMYVELDVDGINDGNFRKSVDAAIQRGFRELDRWEEETMRADGAFEVQATIKVFRMPESNEIFIVEDRVKLKTPDLSHQSTAKGVNGRLICQPEGSSSGDPNQIRLFDRQGRPKAMFDTGTGELIDDNKDDIAGQVGTAS